MSVDAGSNDNKRVLSSCPANPLQALQSYETKKT